MQSSAFEFVRVRKLKNYKKLFSALVITCILVLKLAVANAYTFNKVSFFVVAHQDDWQLFMGDVAYSEMQDPNNKVVIIYTTAGDAGSNIPPYFYSESRQQAAINSVIFAANSNKVMCKPPEKGKRNINGKQIDYFAYKNTVSYFLRLPDGDISQPGLMALYNHTGCSNTLTTPATTYSDWSDLVKTVRAIYTQEGAQDYNAWLHCAETNAKLNPNDHSDHLRSSLAAQEAATNLICNKNFYVEYYATKLKSNLPIESVILKSALLTEYCSVMNQAGIFPNSWDTFHKTFLDRTYYRTVNCLNTNPELLLEQNYPNPFTKNTNLIFEMPQEGFVTINLYSSTGQLVKTYHQKEYPAGRQALILEDSELPGPGVYFCTMEAFGKSTTIKLICN